MKKNRRQSAIKLGVRLPPSLLPKKPTKRAPSPSPPVSPLPSPPTSDDEYKIPRPVPGSLSVIPERRKRTVRCLHKHDTAEKISIQSAASDFRDTMYYGPEKEHRFLIRQHGAFQDWTQPSSRVSWIGVWGTNTATVVSMMDKETLRLCPRLPAGKRQLCVKRVLITALADMFPDAVGPIEPTGLPEQAKLVEQGCSGGKEVVPYAVVSVAPGFVKGISDMEVQQSFSACSFLKTALKDRSSLTSVETKQMATCALKCLLGGSRFQADKIEMRVYGFHVGELDRVSADEVDQYMAQLKATKSFS